MTLEFLQPADETWGAFVKGLPHDFYHLPAYSALMGPFDGGAAEAVLIREGGQFFFLPYIIRPLSHIAWLGSEGKQLFDIVSPYGYPGPLVAGDESFLRRAIAQWCQAMRARGGVSGFVRLHPLINLELAALSAHGELVPRGRTISVDLKLPPQELWRQTSATHRNEISKARRYGLQVAIDESFRYLPEFVAMYHETMDRAGASRYYYFPAEYFDNLRAGLGEKLSLCVVTDAAGKLAAGGLFTECDGIVQYHLSGTFTAALPLHPAKLMLDWVRTWAQQRGNRVFHLGGGMGAREDSLFTFKARFSPCRHPYFTWQLLFEPDTYHGLEHRRRAQAQDVGDNRFFPIYRS